VGEKNTEQVRNGTTVMKNEENKYARQSREWENEGGRKGKFIVHLRGFILELNL
jgi:hypothetical protein